ncbi:MAG: LytR/AlgR family response regulator transcription factor, partial [Stenotrophomonas sp.]
MPATSSCPSSEEACLKVVIADDEPLARERLRSLLAEQPGVEVVAEAENGEQALHACAELQPDL